MWAQQAALLGNKGQLAAVLLHGTVLQLQQELLLLGQQPCPKKRGRAPSKTARQHRGKIQPGWLFALCTVDLLWLLQSLSISENTKPEHCLPPVVTTQFSFGAFAKTIPHHITHNKTGAQEQQGPSAAAELFSQRLASRVNWTQGTFSLRADLLGRWSAAPAHGRWLFHHRRNMCQSLLILGGVVRLTWGYMSRYLSPA